MSCVRNAWPSIAPVGFGEHATRAYVLLRYCGERRGIDRAGGGAQAARLAQSRTIEGVTHRARVGEMRQSLPALDVFTEGRRRGRIEAVVHPVEHARGDALDLGAAVGGELDVMRDAR